MPKLQKTLGRYDGAMEMKIKRKNIFACLFSIHNTISLSRHEQVCLRGLRFERYYSHHRAGFTIMRFDIRKNIFTCLFSIHNREKYLSKHT